MTTSVRTAAVTDDGHDANAVYALGSNTGETARLQRQADELAADSAALLDHVGLRPGHSAIDLGCGPRGILELLAARVSPGGRVIGLDADPVHVAMAGQLAAALGSTGMQDRGGVQDRADVQVLAGDARRTGLPSGSFDLVHARTLLVTLPEPAGVVAEMVRLARPGGWIAALEPDTEYVLCYPPHPAFDRICQLHPVVFGRNGADPNIGRRVPELFRRAGLVDVDLEIRAASYPAGHTRRTIRLDLVRSMRPQIVQLGLASDEELDELDAAARAHLGDPHTVVMSALTFLIWGRKPQPAAGA